MADALRQSRRFDASSPVLRYWLDNCVGFSLAGGGHGTVERILDDADLCEPSVLEVRTGRRRVERVPVSAVTAVIPVDQVLVVDRRRRVMRDRRRETDVRLRWTTRVLRRSAVAGLGALAALAAEALRLGRRGWSAGSPVVARTIRVGTRKTVRLVRSVPWQSYVRSARSATTRLSQAPSSRSSRRRTTSSGRKSASSS